MSGLMTLFLKHQEACYLTVFSSETQADTLLCRLIPEDLRTVSSLIRSMLNIIPHLLSKVKSISNHNRSNFYVLTFALGAQNLDGSGSILSTETTATPEAGRPDKLGQ